MMGKHGFKEGSKHTAFSKFMMRRPKSDEHKEAISQGKLKHAVREATKVRNAVRREFIFSERMADIYIKYQGYCWDTELAREVANKYGVLPTQIQNMLRAYGIPEVNRLLAQWITADYMASPANTLREDVKLYSERYGCDPRFVRRLLKEETFQDL